MQLSILADRQMFEQAAQAARQVGRGENDDKGSALATITPGVMYAQVDEAWDEIEGALRKVFQLGHSKAQGLLDKAIRTAEELVNQAGRNANEVYDLLLSKLRVFYEELVQQALTRFPTQIFLGDKTAYTIAKLSFSQKVALTGSIEFSMTQLFNLVANGEISIMAEYSLKS